MAATTPDTFPVLGTQGYPLFAAVRLGTLSDLGPDIARYRTAYRVAGHPGEGEVYLRIPVYVADTAEQAMAEPEHSIMEFYRDMAAQLAASATQPGALASDLRAERAQALASLTYDQALDELQTDSASA